MEWIDHVVLILTAKRLDPWVVNKYDAYGEMDTQTERLSESIPQAP